MKNHIILFIICISNLYYCSNQHKKNIIPYERIIRHYNENDERALTYVKDYIIKAKKKNDNNQIFGGYKDAVYFSKNLKDKLQYVDSCLYIAKTNNIKDYISEAYLIKGSIYYRYYKQHKPALQNYLLAYNYSKSSSDDYLKNKILFEIGILKNYLGHYQDATNLLKKTIHFFEEKANQNKNSNSRYAKDLRKRYLIGLHQLTINYQHINQLAKADSLIKIGLKESEKNSDLHILNCFFLKSKGISEYFHENYNNSIAILNQVLPCIKANNSAWAIRAYFYLGKNYIQLNNKEKAIESFKNVDSIFSKQNFVVSELRENYEYLIDYYKKINDRNNQLYYTTQLLKVDSITNKDFAFISEKLNKEYDSKELISQKQHLENSQERSNYLVIILSVSCIILIVNIIFFRKRKKRELLITPLHFTSSNNDENISTPIERKIIINDELKVKILKQLETFELKKGYLESGLSIQSLAKKFKTNSNYLSQIINDTKKTNFKRYVSELRINHITESLKTKSKYHNYTIDALAKECGIASRQNFSDLFFEINGIRPTEFIQKIKKEIRDNESPS